MGIKEDLDALKKGQQDILDAIAKAQNGFLREAISLTADLIGIVSIVGLASAVVSLYDLFKGSTAADEAIAKIGQLLQVTFRFDESAAALTQMQRVSDLASEATTRLKTLLGEVPPYTPAALDQLDFITSNDLNKLGSSVSWMRVYFDGLNYRDYWFGTVTPPADLFTMGAGSSFVFDYRLTVPCYMLAIAARVASQTILIGAAFVQKQAMIAESSARAREAQNYYDTILRGFVRSRTPSAMEIVYNNGPIGSPPEWSQWDPPVVVPAAQPTRLIGVVDAYQGAGIVDSVPTSVFPSLALGPVPGGVNPPDLDLAYQVFAARYELGVRRREMRLYSSISLGELWGAIQKLHAAAGEAPDLIDRGQSWSLKDVNVALGTVYAEIINVPPGAPPPPISLSDTIRRLAILGGVDNSQNLFVSWRTAQEAASL
jgi:hypothetical protein